MLETIGIQIQEASRSYITETTDPRFEIVFARTADVPIYVHYGAIDLGMTGYDLILERNVDVFELLDLGFGKCRLVIAAPDKPNGGIISRNSTIPRVVTEFPNLSRQYFERIGTQTEILAVHGAVELAPRLGLAEFIMDITETGETLRKNGLQVIDTVLESSCRLISNKISYRIFEKEINELITKLTISRSENT
jgi:ATP phosphoribosyltransferase